jgi:hypothetical protein
VQYLQIFNDNFLQTDKISSKYHADGNAILWHEKQGSRACRLEIKPTSVAKNKPPKLR